MSAEAMSKAFRALKAEVLRDDFSAQEWSCFKHGWDAAMKFMASPRIPAPDVSEPVKAGEFRQRSVGKMPDCPNCGSNTQVWDTSSRANLQPELRCHRAGCGRCHVTLPAAPDPLQRQYYVPTPVHPGQDALAERFAGDLPPVKWSERDLEAMHRAAEAGNPTPKEHSPHGLVAFYTDAP